MSEFPHPDRTEQTPPADSVFRVNNDGSLTDSPPPAETDSTPGENSSPRMPAFAPARPTPWVTYTLICVTILIWLAQIITKTYWGLDWPGVWGLKLNEYIRAGQVWRLFTPMLLHDDNLPFHILTNMYFLFVVGAEVEKLYGHGRYLTLYILGGLCGNAFSFILSPYGAWGASTALFGLLAANGVFILQNKAFLRDWSRSLRGVMMTIGINIFLGISIGADNWGHIGGALGGALFAVLAGPIWELQEFLPGLAKIQDQRGARAWFNGAALTFFIFILLVVAGFLWGVPGIELQ